MKVYVVENYEKTGNGEYSYILGVFSSLERAKKEMIRAIRNDQIFGLKNIPAFEAGRKNIILTDGKARDCFAFSSNSLDKNGDVSKYEIKEFVLNDES